MKRISIWILAVIFSTTALSGKTSYFKTNSPIGIWMGTMKISSEMEIRVGFEILQSENETLQALMSIIDQRAFDIPMDTIYVTGDSLHIEFAEAGISYSGKLENSGILICGEYKQGGGTFELILKSVEQLPREVVRPQTPKGPYPYDQKEVYFTNETDSVRLSGTLTVPHSGSIHPAVILVHGSGHTDRNETKMGHFALLADCLSRQGFAVLRFDKRGVGSSTGNYDNATTYDFASDVEAGIKYLSNLSYINPDEIGIIGHSEGTLIASMVAAKSDDVAYIVMLGCMGVNGGEIRLQQTQAIYSLNGVPESEINQTLEQIENYHTVIKSDIPSEEKFNKIKSMYPDLNNGLVDYLLKPWYMSFIQIEPYDYLNKVKCPVLALTGEKDLQCPPTLNLPHIKQALSDGGNTEFTIATLPNLNHLFQTAKTGLPIEYDNISEIIAPSALEMISGWMLKNTSKN